MSQYLILIYDDEAAWAEADEPTAAKMLQRHRTFQEANAGAVAGGQALQPVETATVVRPDGAGGFTVTDGPFAETKEALGGYYLVEAPDLDAAIALAKQVPVFSGGLEIRPILLYPR